MGPPSKLSLGRGPWVLLSKPISLSGSVVYASPSPDMTRKLANSNKVYSLAISIVPMSSPYFGHLIRRAESLEKTLVLGKTEGRRRSGQQR